MKTLLALFTVAHGLMHFSYLTPKPNDPKYAFHFDRSWFSHLVGAGAQPTGTIMVLITVTLLALAGLGIWGIPGLATYAKALTLWGMVASLITLVLFWHPWLVLGIVIDLVFIFGILQLGWLRG